MFGVYTVLLKCSLPERLEQLRPKIVKNKGVMLSIDGLQPEKGNDLLFVTRDILLGEVLHAEIVSSSDTETMVRLLQVIHNQNIPVLGIESDAQRSIRKAVSMVLPKIPYQLCQFHYLKDLAKPATDEDRALKTDIKKELRGIRSIEQTLQERTDNDAETLLGFTEAMPPFKKTGNLRWMVEEPKYTNKFQSFITASPYMRKKRDHALEKKIEITGTYTNHRETYKHIKQQQILLREVSSILNPPDKQPAGRQNNNKPLLYQGQYVIYTMNKQNAEQLIGWCAVGHKIRICTFTQGF